MINQKQIRKPSEFSKLVLGGIVIEGTLAGGGGTDFQSITLKDAKTDTILTLSRGPYSDLIVHATFPVKTEKRFVVVAIEPNGEFRSKPLTADELEAVKEAHPGAQVEEIEVPVED